MRKVGLALSLVHAVVAARFYVYENADARQETALVLGAVNSTAECESRCVAALGSDPTAGCLSYTHYHDDYHEDALAGRCFGDNTGASLPSLAFSQPRRTLKALVPSTGTWAPRYSSLNEPQLFGNVTSAQQDPSLYESSCSSRADCSYNGACTDGGVCECYPQWMGKYCGQLNLVATDADAGLQSHDAGGRVSSWGGSVVRGEDGLFHMFAAEMTNNCGIVVWMSNSLIRHAVSASPHGPYNASDVTSAVWGHEPTAARAPTGEFVLWFTANFDTIPCAGVECAPCDDGDSIIAGDACLPDTQCTTTADLLTYMIYADSPYGPWSAPQPVPSASGESWDTNLAPILFADGSLFGLGRPPYVWRAADWRNTSTYTVTEADDGTIQGEDPFVYVDPRDEDGVLHALSHAGGWDPSGGHAWSTDSGATWSRHDDVNAYGSLLLRSDGSSVSLSRRERPHLVMDSDGTPVALTNGVTEAWPCGHPEFCPRDYCYTALQQLNRG